jgi:hypothetical protein
VAGRPDPSAEYAYSQTKAGKANAKRLRTPVKKKKKAAPSSGPKYGATPQRAVAEGKARRQVLNSPAGRQADFIARQNAELSSVEKQYLSSPKTSPRRPSVTPAGLTSDPAAYARIAAIGGGTSNFFTKELGRASNEALGMLTSGPATAQLLAENAAAIPVAPFAVASRLGVPGLGLARQYQDRVFGMDKKAVKETVNFNKYLYGDSWDVSGIDAILNRDGARGKLKKTGEKALEYPLTTALNVMALKSALGRAPAYAARATRAVAPESAAGTAASRSLSTLSHIDRIAQNLAENKRRASLRHHATMIEGKTKAPRGTRELPLAPGDGGRYRPPREYISHATDEPTNPVGTRRLVVDQAPYSGDQFAQTRQRLVDRYRTTGFGRKLEMRANARDVAGKGTFFTKPLGGKTSEAKFAKADARNTREMADRRDAASASLRDRNSRDLAVALAKLKKDTNEAGVAQKRFLHTEEAAVRLHWDDMLSPRGGLTPSQLRDEWVAVKEEQFASNQWDSHKARRNAREQIDAVKNVPAELLDLNDLSNPAVARVKRAVDAGRVVDAANQAQSVKAGVVRPETAAAYGSRASAVDLGGSRWWKTEVNKVKEKHAPELRKLKTQISEARAEGRRADAIKLEKTRRARVQQMTSEINAIKESAINMTPEIGAQREVVAGIDRERARIAKEAADRKVVARKARENQARMYRRDREAAAKRKREESAGRLKTAREERAKAPRRPALARTFSAGSQFGRASRNLELAPKVRGLRHQPGIPTRGSDVMPMGRSKPKKSWQEYRARKLSRDLSPDAPKDRIPHPPQAPGMQRHGISAGQSRPFFNKLNAKAKQSYLRQASQSADKADRQFVAARIAEARQSGRNLISLSEERLLRKNLAAAERRNVETRVAPLKPREVNHDNSLKAARTRELKRLRKMEREAMGMTAPTRPELVGKRGVYIPDRSVRPKSKATGPRTARIGTDEARQNRGFIRTGAELDMRPKLLLEQTRRAAENYNGRRSPAATKELLDTIAYRTDDGGYLRIDSQDARKLADRVAYVNKAKLESALKALDELPNGDWLHRKTVDDIFTDSVDSIPKDRKGDYIAVHKDAKDVWTEMLGPSEHKWVRYWDTGLTYWKGALLALSPRWYLNNTVGLALQYGLLAPGDIVSIFRGNSKRVREAMQNRAAHVARDTLANEAQGSAHVVKVIRRGFEINSRLEEVWRRAAYANRAKRLLQNEGVRMRHLSNDDFARALESMPDAAINQIVRDVDFFIGDFRKFNHVERTIVKRVIPFYSWLRVISRLTFGLPFRSPIRAFALATLGRAATAGLDPYAELRPWYARPALNFGNVQIGVTSASPQMTVAGWIHALGSDEPIPEVFAEFTSFAHPVLNFVFGWPAGLDSFGNRITDLPGEALYGRPPQELNKASGKVENTITRRSAAEALLDLFSPGQKNLFRKVSAGDRTPRDAVDTTDIVADWINRLTGGKRDESLYYKKSKKDPPAVKFPFSPALSALFGVNVVRTNPQALARQAKEEMRKWERDQRKLMAAKRKAKRG